MHDCTSPDYLSTTWYASPAGRMSDDLACPLVASWLSVLDPPLRPTPRGVRVQPMCNPQADVYVCAKHNVRWQVCGRLCGWCCQYCVSVAEVWQAACCSWLSAGAVAVPCAMWLRAYFLCQADGLLMHTVQCCALLPCSSMLQRRKACVRSVTDWMRCLWVCSVWVCSVWACAVWVCAVWVCAVWVHPVCGVWAMVMICANDVGLRGRKLRGKYR